MKHCTHERRRYREVAPRVGAWIETAMVFTQHNSKRSHPVWVRGLKQRTEIRKLCRTRVAPRVGAWIETKEGRSHDRPHQVAPRVGAWIETIELDPCYIDVIRSHPVWVRGLKLYPCFAGTAYPRVAPRVGAWIETIREEKYKVLGRSHPVWVRGLKLKRRGRKNKSPKADHEWRVGLSHL